MRQATFQAVEFGDAGRVDASLSERVRGLIGSEILQHRRRDPRVVAAGKPVCNLTVGDFDPAQFPDPAAPARGDRARARGGHTNYPPSDGVLDAARGGRRVRRARARAPLPRRVGADRRRRAAAALRRVPQRARSRATWSSTRCRRGTTTTTRTCAARAPVEIPTRGARLPPDARRSSRRTSRDARLLRHQLAAQPDGHGDRSATCCAGSASSSSRRTRAASARDARALFLLLRPGLLERSTFGGRAPRAPRRGSCPRSRRTRSRSTRVSKAFAATGLRVGWALMAARGRAQRMADILGHVGAWAPQGRAGRDRRAARRRRAR